MDIKRHQTRMEMKALRKWPAVIAAALLLATGTVGGVDAADRMQTRPGEDEPAGELILRGSVLMGMSVESRAEKPIGEIVDLVVDSGGRVRFVVVETDKAFLDIGGRRVAVDFDKIGFVTEWVFREKTMVSGTEKRLAVGAARGAVYNGTEADLRQLPEFDPLSPRPGGAGTGWGIYSAPPGPAN